MSEIVIGRSESDFKKYGTEGTVFIGKQYIKMGKTMSLANKVLLDVVRPHVILIAGKRGEGKCLYGDTEIVLNNGEVKKIKELAEDENEVLALNNTLKITSTNKTKFYVREVNELIKIELKSGKTIKLTPEHPLLTILGWENAKNLRVGSRIATPRRIDVFGSEHITDTETKLLSYLLAEGHLGNRLVLFTNSDKKIISEFKNEVKKFDSNLTTRYHGKYSLRVVDTSTSRRILNEKRTKGKFAKGIIFNSKNSLKKWLEIIGVYGRYALEKTIPSIIFKTQKHKVALFLNRLFSCDGSIYPHESGWVVSYSSSSKKMAQQVQHLLLRFGIISKLRKKITPRHINYELLIRDKENVVAFIQNIGFFGDKELKANLALKELTNKKNNSNVDTIPKEIWNWYRPQNWSKIGKALGYSTPKGIRSSINYAPTREKLMQIAKLDRNKEALLLAGSDIFWDEIVNIRKIKGRFNVYDISVPNYHNFVANDIIVHNSYTMSQIAESVAFFLPKKISQNLAFLFLDTMGIFWTMKYPNYRDEVLLHKWGLNPKGLTNIRLFVPGGKFKELKDKGIPVDEKFYLTTSDIGPLEWCLTFGIKPTDFEGILISKIITMLRKKGELFGIDDIIAKIKEDKKTNEKVKASTITRFESIKEWGLFAKEGTPINKILEGGVISVLDMSVYSHLYGSFSIRALVIALFAKKILEQRETARKLEEESDVEKGFAYFGRREIKKKKVPMIWIFIDEIHEFLPLKGSTLATGPLLQIIREGRQPGISLVVATQQPGKMNTDVLSQCDLVISHRVTSKMDIEALNTIMQSFMTQTLSQALSELPKVKGCALILDQNQERVYSVQMRPKFSWHGGETPTAIPPKGKEF